MKTSATHYDALGVSPSAATPDIRRAYVNLARKFHPDFHVDQNAAVKDHAATQMRRINEAWSTLNDAKTRERYDRDLRDRYGAPSTGSASASTNSGYRYEAGIAAPEPSSGHTPPRFVQLLPVILLAAALALVGAGAILRYPAMQLAGIGLALLGAMSFIAVPIFVLTKAKAE